MIVQYPARPESTADRTVAPVVNEDISILHNLEWYDFYLILSFVSLNDTMTCPALFSS
jgi:hypothetical protein